MEDKMSKSSLFVSYSVFMILLFSSHAYSQFKPRTGLSTLTYSHNDSYFLLTTALRSATRFAEAGLFLSIPMDDNLQKMFDTILGLDLKATF
jgi:hypothetical protein